MNAMIPLMSALSGVLLVLFPGWGAKQILVKFGLRWQSDSASAILTSFSLGIHVNALMFLFCWVFVSGSPSTIGISLLVLDIAIGCSGLIFKGSVGPVRSSLWAMIMLGLVVGEYASFQFPNVLDSVQILEVQQYLQGWVGGVAAFPTVLARAYHILLGGMTVPTQPGFAGLIFIPSLLQPNLPVATSAAGMRVILFALAAVVSDYAAKQFGFRPRVAAALLILANLVFSHYGLYGMFFVGKDSIFAVLLAIASVAAIYNTDPDSNEPGLFMSAAVLLGAVVVPYLLLFWAIYFFVSPWTTARRVFRQAIWCVYPLTIAVVGVRAAFAAAGSHVIGLLPAFIAEITVLAIAAYTFRKLRYEEVEAPQWWRFVLACIPAVSIIGIVLLLPAKAHIIQGYRGTAPVVMSYPPLDGVMTAFGYFYKMTPMNNPWLSTVAVIMCGLAPLVIKRFRSPFFIALFAFLPTSAFLVLIHLRLGLHILPDFNIWDVTRDTVQWYVGAFAAIIALIGLAAIGERLSPAASVLVVPVAAALFLVGVQANFKYFAWLLNQPVTMTSSGGYLDAPTARASDFLWREARGELVFVSQESALGTTFPIYQMYGARRVAYFSDESLSTSSKKSIVYLVNGKDAKKAVEFGSQNHADVDVLGLSSDSYIVHLKFDGGAKLTATDVPKLSVGIDESAYPIEHAQGRTFRWIGPDSKLTLNSILGGGEQTCVDLQLINPWGDKSLSATITTSREQQTVDVPFDATFANPLTKQVCLSLADHDETIEVKSNKPAQHFPDDYRNISFGLVWPPAPH
ncbi:hypothetical protein ACMX25_26830 [Caballeronia sp. 15715]|uniref:hypothetical protein n=1 Tax=Caballeronia sp. 15715 TaxID=3391030 RepID=UPI0039E4D95F